jgi:maltose alpha-D-glucosyltransferase/alpha-amylase
MELSGAAATTARIADAFPVTVGAREIWFLIARAEFPSGMPETVSLPVTFVPEAELGQLLMPVEQCGLARVTVGEAAGVLCHAMAVPACSRGVLDAILKGERIRRGDHELVAVPMPGVAASLAADLPADLPISFYRSNRNNTSIVFGEAVILKTFRRVEDGVNPDLEVGRFLATRHVEYRRHGSEPATLAVLHRFVPNQGTAWQHTLDQLSSYFEHVAALSREQPPVPPPVVPLFAPEHRAEHPPAMDDPIDAFTPAARLIARRTAELHLALAAPPGTSAFALEPFGKLYQRSLYQSMRNLTGRLCYRLTRERHKVPEDARPLAERLVSLQEDVMRRFRAILDPHIGGARIRCHGDFNLGQLLFTGKDYAVIDFEGEPARTIGERRVKRSPLWDVAGMVRSFDYAGQSVLLGLASPRGRSPGLIRSEDRHAVSPWASAWFGRVARAYVAEYMTAMEGSHLLPPAEDSRRTLLELLLLEKALHEADLELTYRPEWLTIPLRGALRLFGCDPSSPDLCL